MRTAGNIILLILFFACTALAQNSVDSIAALKTNFESFRYREVISTGERLLRNDNLNKEQKIEIYRIVGISQFTLMENNAAEQSFRNILNLDSSFVMDSSNTSPKIIEFFNGVKKNFKISADLNRVQKVRTDTVYINKQSSSPGPGIPKGAVIGSFLFPGLGHLYEGNRTKGWILCSLSALTVGSAIYYSVRTGSTGRTYHNAVDPSQIENDYSAYNSAYKMRNFSIAAFAAVWIYSQIDLLFVSSPPAAMLPSIGFSPSSGLNLNFKVAF